MKEVPWWNSNMIYGKRLYANGDREPNVIIQILCNGDRQHLLGRQLFGVEWTLQDCVELEGKTLSH